MSGDKSFIFKLILLIIFLVISFRLFNLQIYEDKYRELSQNNTVHLESVYPSRGIVFDRNDFDSFCQFDDYDMIVSNMALHWSANFNVFIERILNQMRKNTIFIFSIPDNKSFSFLKKVKLEELINEFPEKKKYFKKN